MRRWLGTVLLAAVAIAAGAFGTLSDLPIWAVVLISVFFFVGALLMLPMRGAGDEQPGSAFIRGSADGSRFRAVDVQADDFITGDARSARFADVIFRSTRKRGTWRE